jgi:hypothetical protein
MSTLIVKVGNAQRQPLPDQMDVQLVSARTGALVQVARNVPGHAEVTFERLADFQPYIVKVFPVRHRPVAQFAILKPGEAAVAQLFAPLDPSRVDKVSFPAYGAIAPELRQVLERSDVEGAAGKGEATYAALADTQKAGLFNLFAKMSTFGFDAQRTVWTFVERLYRIRADRIFVEVEPGLRDLVKGAIADDRFREVSGKLHTPPPGFAPAGSFKTSERYGNLQLSFFSSQQAPLAFRVDADIDDAAGLEHAFQVIRNFVTQGTTHPYDIHEILVFRQEATLPYDLA